MPSWLRIRSHTKHEPVVIWLSLFAFLGSSDAQSDRHMSMRGNQWGVEPAMAGYNLPQQDFMNMDMTYVKEVSAGVPRVPVEAKYGMP